MKLRYEFVTNEVAGNMIAVAAGEGMEKFRGYLKMDKTGAFIFNLLKEETTIEKMFEDLKAEYPDENDDEIKETIAHVVATLREDNLIED